MLKLESLKRGHWFLLKNNECAELESVLTDDRMTCPVILKDKDGNLIPVDNRGWHLRNADSPLSVARMLPSAKDAVSLRGMSPGQLVLFRDYTLGILETLANESQSRHQYTVRSLKTGEVTSHSTHGWSWRSNDDHRDILVCFQSSVQNPQHKSNADVLRKMIDRLARSVEKLTKEERTLEFERARAGINHLLDKMEEDLDEQT
jgi:hypothetical protein